MTPKNQNIAIGVAASLIILGYVLFHNTTSGNGIDPTNNTNGNNDPNFDAHGVAMDLWEAMKDWGTDEDAIVSILTPVNAAQFDLVFAAFGALRYNPLTGDQVSYSGIPLSRYDLKGWLKSELSASEYANFKRKYPRKL